MEINFKGPASRIEDVGMFGKLLSKSRSNLGKNVGETAIDLSVSSSSVIKWERGEIFPDEDKLPAIAIAYNIDLKELARVFGISKSAREMEKKSRRSSKPIPRSRELDFPSSTGYRTFGKGGGASF